MRLFDITDYELPDYTNISWEKTKYNVGIFLATYKTSRERVGLPMVPKISTIYHLDNAKNEELLLVSKLNKDEDYMENYIELHKLFVLGYSAIMHPYKIEITERRRHTFMLRYVYGLPINLVIERVHYQKNVVIEDSKISFLQFAYALKLVE